MSADEKNYDLGDPIPLGSDDEPLAIEGGDDEGESGESKITTFGAHSGLTRSEQKFQRPLNFTGRGATRVRTFHAKLNDGAFQFLDGQINEWIDQNPDVEVKFCNTTIGVVEGKRPEPQVIMNVWY